MKWQIKLINVGRDDTNSELEFEGDLEEAIGRAVHECHKYLMSSDVSVEPTSKTKILGIYFVYAGFRKVGEVTIKEIKK